MDPNAIIVTLLILPLIFATEVPVIPTDTGRICPLGEIENGNTCVPCPDGAFRSNITSNPLFCTPCPAGFASTSLTPAAFSSIYYPRLNCKICATSTFQDLPAQSTCKQCPPNSLYLNDLSIPKTNCTQCPPDTFVNKTDGRTLTCETCPVGLFLSTNTFGKRSCFPCTSGKFTDKPNSTFCKSCPAGSFPSSKTGPCSPCKPGYSSTAGSESCTACYAGFYQPNTNTSSCIRCPSGSTSAPAAAYCNSTAPARSCSPGSFLTPTGTCERCPEGTVSPGGAAVSCSQCTPPSFPDSTGAQCRCKEGFFILQSYQYQQDCAPCPLRSITDGISCSCPAPLYLSERVTVSGSTERVCACPAGRRYDGSKCVQCEAGAVAGEGSCDFCGASSAVDPETGRCVPCDERRGRPTFDETCKCPEGYFYDKELTRCLCKRGSFPGPPSETPKECLPCPEGTLPFRDRCEPRCKGEEGSPDSSYWDGEKCVQCESGLQAFNGRCIPRYCKPDMHLNREKGVCQCNRKTLPDGTCQDCLSSSGFRLDRDKNECVCKNGLLIKEGACVPCPAGFTSHDGYECTPCAGKRYKPEGEGLCSYCAEASADIVGATACVKAKCKDDEFETEDGTCAKCKAGQRVRNGVCVDCAAGEVSAGGRRGYCSKCVSGIVANGERSACVPS